MFNKSHKNKIQLNFQLFCYSGPKVIKLFSSSSELSMKFQLLINAKIVKISAKFSLKTGNLTQSASVSC